MQDAIKGLGPISSLDPGLEDVYLGNISLRSLEGNRSGENK